MAQIEVGELQIRQHFSRAGCYSEPQAVTSQLDHTTKYNHGITACEARQVILLWQGAASRPGTGLQNERGPAGRKPGRSRAANRPYLASAGSDLQGSTAVGLDARCEREKSEGGLS